MINLLPRWENPRRTREPQEHEPPLERRIVEVTLIVDTNEDDQELLRKVQRFLVGPDEPDKLGRVYSRMPWWLRRVDVDTVLRDDDA